MDPHNFNIPHPTFRPHQLETLLWTLDGDGFKMIEASTGSGKSACAKGVSSRKGTTVLTRTKALQDAYADIYRAHVLKGKSNYDCQSPDAYGLSCEECPLEDMRGCVYGCPYLQARALAMEVPFVATNYAYWMSSPSYRKAQTGAVFLDECHTLPDQTIEWSGITVADRQRLDWDLPQFPELRSECVDYGSRFADPIPEAADWLVDCREILLKRWKELKKRGTSKKNLKMLRACRNLGLRVRAAADALRRDANRASGIESDWYVRSGQQGRKYYNQWVPAFVALAPRFCVLLNFAIWALSPFSEAAIFLAGPVILSCNSTVMLAASATAAPPMPHTFAALALLSALAQPLHQRADVMLEFGCEHAAHQRIIGGVLLNTFDLAALKGAVHLRGVEQISFGPPPAVDYFPVWISNSPPAASSSASASPRQRAGYVSMIDRKSPVSG